MDNGYVWNLNDIYDRDKDFEEDIEKLKSKMKEIVEFKGKLAQDSNEVLNCYNILAQALELEEKLYGYVMLKYHKDMSNTDSIKDYKKIESLVTEFSEKISFITPELSKIEDEKLKQYLIENQELRNSYKKSIEDIIKEKKHILSKEIEEVLAKYSEIFGTSENVYDIFTNTEFDFPNIKDKEENDLKVTAGLYSKYMTNKDVAVRKQAFESMYS